MKQDHDWGELRYLPPMALPDTDPCPDRIDWGQVWTTGLSALLASLIVLVAFSGYRVLFP